MQIPGKDFIHMSAVLLTAMKIFNCYAASTWALGGFYFSDLKELREIQTEKDLGEEGEIDSDSNDEAEPVEQENKSTRKQRVNDTYPRVEKCGSFYIDFFANLKWMKTKLEKEDSSQKSPELEGISDDENNLDGGKLKKSLEEAVKENVALSYTYTEEIKKALNLVNLSWKKKVS